MTSPPHRRILPRLEDTAPPRQPPALSEDLLEDILLRVASPVDLARAAATCRSFRRIITNPSFQRRYRSLYPPLLLGILCDGIQPAAAPHPNAPAARSLANNDAGFSFDCYLPGDRWQRCDVRDGRLLLERLVLDDEDSVFSPELAVCDPVYRSFRLLPPIPEELIAAYAQVHKNTLFEAFLVPSGQEGTSFKVIGRTHWNDKLVVFIFSSDSNLWSLGTSTTWVDLGLSAAPPNFVLGWPQYERGCFYWKVNWRNKLLKLDMDRMEFSTVNLPPGNNGREVVIVESGEGRLGMFSLTRDGRDMHYFTSMKSKAEEIEASEWLVENTIPLPYNCNIAGAFEGYIFLLGVETHQGRVEAACYSLEIKTLKIERVNSMNYLYVHIHPYFGYPPFMSPPRIEMD